MRVAVGLSGGVDSAVAALLLKEQGHEVVGVSMRIWDGRPLSVRPGRHACYGPEEEEDIAQAQKICEALGIPFHVVDLIEEYNEKVLNFCSLRYLAGATPNPCVYCNRLVKFEGIPKKLENLGVKVDAFATGHYARVTYEKDLGRYVLRKAVDISKDQSYFLYLLTQEQLARTFFPLGDLKKQKVRELARKIDLPVANKAESQDFVAGGYRQLFGGETKPGPLLDEEGNVLGEHRGIQYYTVGQRRGLGIACGRPLYVIGIDPERNAVIVGPEERLYRRRLVASELNWIAGEDLKEPMEVFARIRYRHKEAAAVVEPRAEGSVTVTFREPQRAITPGQAVVFYREDLVLGGGTIKAVLE